MKIDATPWANVAEAQVRSFARMFWSRAVKYLPFLAAGILATLAVLHLAYTIHDFMFEPRYFSPRDQSLLAPMRATRNALTPTGRDYWSALLGFHMSHSIGVMLFALLIVLANLHQTDWLKLFLVCLGGVFTWIAWRFWFHIPFYGCAAATTLMLAGWTLR
jgi:hypothetical protein